MNDIIANTYAFVLILVPAAYMVGLKVGEFGEYKRIYEEKHTPEFEWIDAYDFPPKNRKVLDVFTYLSDHFKHELPH